MEEVEVQELRCSQCSNLIEEQQVYCTYCGFPEQGTEQEKSKFHAGRVIKARTARSAKDGVKSARNTLFIMSALMGIAGIFYFFSLDGDIGVLITYMIIAVIYVLLGFWSQEKPLIALILGLLVYLTLIVTIAIISPVSIFSGIIIKIIIITYLARGINGAAQLKKV